MFLARLNTRYSGNNSAAISEIRVYPNPAGDKLYIALEMYDFETISLNDAAGKLVLNKLLVRGINTVSLMDLPAGVFTLILSVGADSRDMTGVTT